MGESSKQKRILIAVDNSRNAELAFEYYAQYLHKPDHEVTIFHVSDFVYPTAYLYDGSVGLEPAGMQAAANALRQKNEALKKKYKVKCEAGHIKHHFATVAQGPSGAGADIVDAAKKRNVHLIIIGCRGLGSVRRTVLGSVSDYVVHHSHLPTLVCPKHA